MLFKKTLFVITIFMASGLLFLIGGCSDDKDELNSGSLSDAEFMVVQEQIDDLVDSTLVQLLYGLKTITSVQSSGLIAVQQYIQWPNGGNSSAGTYYTGNAHFVSFDNTTSEIIFSFDDSIRFYQNDQATNLGLEADSLFYFRSWHLTTINPNPIDLSTSGQANYFFRNIQTPQATIEGAYNLEISSTYQSVDSTVLRVLKFSSDISNIVIKKAVLGWTQACPTSGRIYSTLKTTYQKGNSNPVVSSWDVVISLINGSMSVRVISGNQLWKYEKELCTIPL